MASQISNTDFLTALNVLHPTVKNCSKLSFDRHLIYNEPYLNNLSAPKFVEYVFGKRDSLPIYREAKASIALFLRLASNGAISQIGVIDGLKGDIEISRLMPKEAIVQGVQVGSREMFLRINQAITLNQLHPIVHQIYPSSGG